MSSNKFELTPSVSIIIAGVIVASAIVFVNMHPGAAAEQQGGAPTPTALSIRPPSASDHIIGSPDAPIVLIEYSDFQCPYCSVVYPTLKKIVDDSHGQIAWVYRQMPLATIHPEANPSANAAECIAEQLGNAGFWKYTEAIFTNQTRLSQAYSANLAGQWGVDVAKYTACVDGKKYQSKIDADTAEAQQNGGNGTPFTVVVNTKSKKMVPLSGALSEAQFMSVINAIK